MIFSRSRCEENFNGIKNDYKLFSNLQDTWRFFFVVASRPWLPYYSLCRRQSPPCFFIRSCISFRKLFSFDLYSSVILSCGNCAVVVIVTSKNAIMPIIQFIFGHKFILYNNCVFLHRLVCGWQNGYVYYL